MSTVKLSADDWALAESSVQLAIAWWKDKPASGFKRQQTAALRALNKKLARVNNELAEQPA